MIFFIMSGCSSIKELPTSNSEFAVMNVGASYSPDGKKFIFASNRSGESSIFEYDFNGTSVVELTKGYHGDEWSSSGSYNPNGTTIIFDSNMKQVFQPFELNFSTSQFIIRLSSYGSAYRGVSYSYDGTKIVYAKMSTDLQYYNICIADVDGKNEKYITKNKYNDLRPSMSKSGLIVFYRIIDDETDIILVNSNDSSLKETNITRTLDIDEYDPVFAHNSDVIYFVQGKINDVGRILSMNSDGSNTKVIVDKLGHYQSVATSFDDKKLLFSFKEKVDDPLDIYQTNSDGSSLKQLTFGISNTIK